MTRHFRLQSVLEHKQQQEQQQARALSALEVACARTRAALDALRSEEEEQLGRIADIARGGPLDPEAYRTATSYLGSIEGSIAEQRTALTEAEERAVEGRDALLAILKEKRSLERLRERQGAEADRDDARREASRVDEFTSARYARRAVEGI
ncbi:MAG: flagellar export protein FliJ [Dehalococcoidia bacterium]